MEPTDNIFKPYKWINEAAVFNKNMERIPSEWLENNADVIALLFSAHNIDKDGLVEKFCEIYENVKFVNVPIEVIYVPLDDTEDEMAKAYENQANWFTIKHGDPLISVLKYMYAITCIPHLLVMRPDGTVISSHALLDLEKYGKNAVITWLSKSATTKKFRRFSKELSIYGDKWNYLNVDPQKRTSEYTRKFSNNYQDSSFKLPTSSNISNSIS